MQLFIRYYKGDRIQDESVQVKITQNHLYIFAQDRRSNYQIVRCNLNCPDIAIKWNFYQFFNQNQEFYIYKPKKYHTMVSKNWDQYIQLKKYLSKYIPISTDLQDSFPNLKSLLRGQYQNIQLGRNVKTNEELILKQLFISNCLKEEEFQILEQINKNPHRNLLSYKNHYVQEDQQYISMDYCKFGSLSNLYQLYQIPNNAKWYMYQQILSGIFHLHSMNIIHRDIKLDNILISNLEDFEIKIIDYGLSHRGEQYDRNGGTSYYKAPEVEANQIYTNKCDIYSAGIVFLELLLGSKIGYESKDYYISQILDKRGQEEGIKEAIDLIKQMLQEDPNLRFSAEDCLCHELFNSDFTYLDQIYTNQFRLGQFHQQWKQNRQMDDPKNIHAFKKN